MEEITKKNNKQVWGIGLFLLFVAGCFYFYLKGEQFNVEYKVCDISYKDCQVIAKFKDRYDCEITKEKWGWRCDSVSNPALITCTRPTDSFAAGFCD